MKIKIDLLKAYKFNKEFFEDIKGTDYDALKEDISQNGIKVDLHITKSNTILCGHQRWNIAKEIGLKEIPVKIVEIDENDERKVKEYVIKDNLLRRHLSTEQKYILIATLSEVYEVGRGGDRVSKDAKVASLVKEEIENVLTKTAKDTGVAERTVARARQYRDLVKKSPELKKKKVTELLNNYEIKNDKVVRKNTKEDLNLNLVSAYDENLYYLKGNCSENRFGDTIVDEKNYYPTITRLSRLFHEKDKEFSLREYANIQDFEKSYKFVGSKSDIKDQIGEAVSPKMGNYIVNKHIKGKKYIELFCGCGGFSANLSNKAIWAIDFNKMAGYSYKMNNPNTEVYIGDIQECNEKQIHKEIGDIDFILGGPPCQGFSIAGHKLGFKEDSRNQLYLEFLRFVKEFKPKQFIMENVKEILNYKDEIIKDFEDIGYKVIVEKVCGLDIKMKQNRIRVFFIGKLKNGN